MDAVRRAVAERGAQSVCCVLTTTSCFAPRAADDVEAVARLCKEADVPHLINHAYGLQCARSTKLIARAGRVGRVDAFVSSTDKNFMVPVGGAVIGGRLGALAGAEYAGRASSGPVLDLFVTALSMGVAGWTALLARREALFDEVCCVLLLFAISDSRCCTHTHADSTHTGCDACAGFAAAAHARQSYFNGTRL